MNYGLQSNIDGHYFDDVIPLGFDPDEHPFREAADEPPFALFVGRIFVKKGIEVACKAARVAGLPLKVVGHGDPALVTDGAELVGTLSRDARNDIMSRAAVVCMPTTYFEPFGSVAVEAQKSGTPVVASHFGAFIETIEHGKTGFLCSYIGEFAAALNAARSLDRRAIRERAVARYGLQTVAQDYQRYFDRLSLLWERGFDTEEALPGWEQRRC
jgi:glycosyltransferase involved in cell wall biosynthesis